MLLQTILVIQVSGERKLWDKFIERLLRVRFVPWISRGPCRRNIGDTVGGGDVSPSA